MHDLSDVTFTIPVKIDQPDRAINLETVTTYLVENFNTNIIICEMDSYVKVREIVNPKVKYKHIFMKTQSKWFHRTRMLNYMANISETPIIVNYDADVILDVAQILKSVKSIRSKSIDMVFPYDGNFLNVPPDVKKQFTQSLDYDVLTKNKSRCKNLRPSGDSVGGVIIWNKEIFNSIGGENENFISWGFEDSERFERAKKLGVKIGRIVNPLYHLFHKSSENSTTNAHPFYRSNEKEFEKIKKMSKQDLQDYISTWGWINA